MGWPVCCPCLSRSTKQSKSTTSAQLYGEAMKPVTKYLFLWKGKVGNRWQLWVFHSHQSVVYLLKSSRSAQVPLDYFNKQTEGILVVDRYSAYKKLARLYRRTDPGILLGSSAPGFSGLCDQMANSASLGL